MKPVIVIEKISAKVRCQIVSRAQLTLAIEGTGLATPNQHFQLN